MSTISLVSETETDPYSCFWAEIPAGVAADAATYFFDSPDWHTVREPHPTREAYPHCVTIENTDQVPMHFATTDPAVADAASDALVALLGRGPDSLH